MINQSLPIDPPAARRLLGVARGVRPLLRPFWLREARSRWLLGLLALSLVTALGTAVYAYAFEVGIGTEPGDPIQRVVALTGGFQTAIGAVFAVVTVLVSIDRMASMHDEGWCLPLLARGTPAASIVLATLLILAGVVLAAFTVSYLVFGILTTILRLTPVGTLVVGYVAVAPALAAWTAFGVLAGVLARGRGLAIAFAVTALVIPTILITAWTVTFGDAPPAWTISLWALLVPLPLHSANWHLFAERIRYVCCAVLFAGLLSRRWLVSND